VRELGSESEYARAVGLPAMMKTDESPDKGERKDESDDRIITA